MMREACESKRDDEGVAWFSTVVARKGLRSALGLRENLMMVRRGGPGLFS
jgi:hypothetical protein